MALLTSLINITRLTRSGRQEDTGGLPPPTNPDHILMESGDALLLESGDLLLLEAN